MRAASSGMGRKAMERTLGLPFQYASFASSTTRTSFSHSLYLKAPLPTGFLANSAQPTCLI